MRRHLVTPFIIPIFLISACWFLAAFGDFECVKQFDWDQTLAYHQLERQIVLDYGQFPLWNPYICGGEPWLAHPESDFLSLHFLFPLFFGTITGVIVTYFFHVFLGMTGMYYLGRKFGLNTVLSLLSAVFFLNGFSLLAYVSGLTHLNVSLLPLIYIFYNKCKSEKKYVFLVSALLAYLLYAGGYYILIFASMIISIDGLFYLISKKNTKFIFYLFLIAIFTILFASAKLIPMLELIIKYPRHVYLSAPWSFLNVGNIGNFVRFKIFANIFGPGFSLMTCFVFFASFFLLWKKFPVLVFMNLFFLLLFLGDASPVNLWRIFHFFLPSFKENAIFYLPLSATLSLSLGLAASEIEAILPKKFKVNTLVGYGLFFLALSAVFLYAGRIFSQMSPIGYHLSGQKSGFCQIAGEHYKMYESVCDNKGALYGYDSIGNQIRSAVVPSTGPGYRGEYFLAHGFGKINEAEFSPNRMKFKLDLDNEEVLVVNQNYFNGWRSSSGRVVNYNGLMGVILDKQDKEVSLYYLSTSFIIGLCVFLAFILAQKPLFSKLSANK